jgi:hypothetical protein
MGAKTISGCRVRSATYPPSLRGLLSIKGQYGIPCLPAFQANDLSVMGLWNNRFDFHDYQFVYWLVDGREGKAFCLEARPKEYAREACEVISRIKLGWFTPRRFLARPRRNDPDAACEAKQPQQCSDP